MLSPIKRSTAAGAQCPKSATAVAVWLLGLTVFFAVAPLTAHARWYDPERGVFMSRAPYRPDVEHSYNFCLQDPINFVDVDGNKPNHWDLWNPFDNLSYGVQGNTFTENEASESGGAISNCNGTLFWNDFYYIY